MRRHPSPSISQNRHYSYEKKNINSIAIGDFVSTFTSGQTIHFQLPDLEAQNGDALQIQITTTGFDEMVSMQFSINWDPTVITYVSHQPADLQNVAIGNPEAELGKLRLSWFDVEGNGFSLPDNASIIALNFLVIGTAGDYTDLNITDDPLAIQIFQTTDTPGIFTPVSVDQTAGSVTVIAPGTISTNSQAVSCFGNNDGSINLSVPAGENYSFNWTGPDNFFADTEDLQNLSAGDYQVTVTNDSGAIIYENTVTVIQPSPMLLQNIELTPATCNQQVGTADILITGGVPPFSFDIGSQNNNTGIFTNLSAGNYALTATDNNQCTLVDTFFIQAADAPQVDLGEDVAICEGESVVLDAGQYLNYQWSDGTALNTLTVNQSGTYSVTVSNDPSCPGTAEIEITVMNIPNLSIENDNLNICPGDSLQLEISGGTTYYWSGPVNYLSAVNVADPIAYPDSTVSFQVMSENECGSDEMEVEVVVVAVTAAAGPDTCIILDTEARLMAFGGVSYFWHPNEYPVSDDEIYDPVAHPLDSTTYFVTIIDANHCEVTDSMIVLVATDPLSTIKAVNMITPNGDGKNDFLMFKGLQKFGPNSLKIYNRWGALIYQKVNYHHDNEVFDGTYKNKPLPSGNYYYILSFQSGEIKQKLTIVRD